MNRQLVSTIRRSCPVECLAPLLSQPTFDALREGLDGSLGTVDQVIKLCEQRRLMELYNIGPSRAGEIRECLIEAKLIEPIQEPLIRHAWDESVQANGHHQSCRGV
jgi:hypothetical protein